MIKYCCDWCGSEVGERVARINTVTAPALYEDYFMGIKTGSLHTCKDIYDTQRCGRVTYIICDKCLTKIWRLRNVDDKS